MPQMCRWAVALGCLLAASGWFSTADWVSAAGGDAAKGKAIFQAKCVTCHGPKADKKFDVAKSDDENVQVILKGKKAEKPPNMPGYEKKHITAENAKALVDYMKSLRQ